MSPNTSSYFTCRNVPGPIFSAVQASGAFSFAFAAFPSVAVNVKLTSLFSLSYDIPRGVWHAEDDWVSVSTVETVVVADFYIKIEFKIKRLWQNIFFF